MSLVVLTTAVAHLAQRLNFKYHFWPIICKILFLEGGRKPELCSEPPLTPRSPIFLVGPSCLSNWTNYSDRCWNSFKMDESFFKLALCISILHLLNYVFTKSTLLHSFFHKCPKCHFLSQWVAHFHQEWIMSCSCASWASSELQHLSTVDTLSALSWPSTDCCFLSASRRPSDAYHLHHFALNLTTRCMYAHSNRLN